MGAAAPFDPLSHPRAPTGQFKQGQGKAGEPAQPNASVVQLQRRLRALGYDTGPIDGVFGGKTLMALRRFQAQHGLPESGTADEGTVRKLQYAGSAPTRARGAAGARSTRGLGSSTLADDGTMTVSTPDGKSVTLKPDDYVLDKHPGSTTVYTTDGRVFQVKGGTRKGRKAKGLPAGHAKDGTLSRGAGMTGKPDAGVHDFQQQLDDLGYDLGGPGVDGRFGPITEGALRAFQKAVGLPETGKLDKRTRTGLDRAYAKRQTAKSTDGHLFADEQLVAGKGRRPATAGKRRTRKDDKVTGTRAGTKVTDTSSRGGKSTALVEASNVGGSTTSLAGTATAWGGVLPVPLPVLPPDLVAARAALAAAAAAGDGAAFVRAQVAVSVLEALHGQKLTDSAGKPNTMEGGMVGSEDEARVRLREAAASGDSRGFVEAQAELRLAEADGGLRGRQRRNREGEYADVPGVGDDASSLGRLRDAALTPAQRDRNARRKANRGALIGQPPGGSGDVAAKLKGKVGQHVHLSFPATEWGAKSGDYEIMGEPSTDGPFGASVRVRPSDGGPAVQVPVDTIQGVGEAKGTPSPAQPGAHPALPPPRRVSGISESAERETAALAEAFSGHGGLRGRQRRDRTGKYADVPGVGDDEKRATLHRLAANASEMATHRSSGGERENADHAAADQVRGIDPSKPLTPEDAAALRRVVALNRNFVRVLTPGAARPLQSLLDAIDKGGSGTGAKGSDAERQRLERMPVGQRQALAQQKARIAAGDPVVELNGKRYTTGNHSGSHWVEVGSTERLAPALHDKVDAKFNADKAGKAGDDGGDAVRRAVAGHFGGGEFKTHESRKIGDGHHLVHATGSKHGVERSRVLEVKDGKVGNAYSVSKDDSPGKVMQRLQDDLASGGRPGSDERKIARAEGAAGRGGKGMSDSESRAHKALQDVVANAKGSPGLALSRHLSGINSGETRVPDGTTESEYQRMGEQLLKRIGSGATGGGSGSGKGPLQGAEREAFLARSKEIADRLRAEQEAGKAPPRPSAGERQGAARREYDAAASLHKRYGSDAVGKAMLRDLQDGSSAGSDPDEMLGEYEYGSVDLPKGWTLAKYRKVVADVKKEMGSGGDAKAGAPRAGTKRAAAQAKRAAFTDAPFRVVEPLGGSIRTFQDAEAALAHAKKVGGKAYRGTSMDMEAGKGKLLEAAAPKDDAKDDAKGDDGDEAALVAKFKRKGMGDAQAKAMAANVMKRKRKADGDKASSGKPWEKASEAVLSESALRDLAHVLAEPRLLDAVDHLGDDPAWLLEAADSLLKASTPEPFSTSKTSNWVARLGGLPNYIQHVAHGIMRSGNASESSAIRKAIGVVKRWCAGGGSVDATTKAAACKAVAEWEALKAKAKAA